jgi:multiple sugar transport system permease protein
MAVSAASQGAAAARPLPARRKHSPVRRLETRAAYLFLLPWFVGLFGVTVTPIVVSFYLSFTDYNVMTSPRWVGLENYERLLFDDHRFWQSVEVTMKYVLWSVPLVLIFSLAIAVALNRGLRGLAIYRSLF